MLEQVYPERLQPTERTHVGEVRGARAVDSSCYGKTTTPHSLSPSGGRGWQRTQKSSQNHSVLWVGRDP